MNKKQTIRLNENQLKRIIKESVKRLVNEEELPAEERFYREIQIAIIEAGRKVCYRWECVPLPFELDAHRLYDMLEAAIEEILEFAYYKVGERS